MDLRSARLAAVQDNAAWCAAVARACGAGSRAGERWWAADGPMPPFFPDVVTTAPALTAQELPRRPGTVKDSFADCDLSPLGRSVLLEGRWLVLTDAGSTDPGSTDAGSTDAGAAVEAAPGAMPPGALDWAVLHRDPDVRLLAVPGHGTAVLSLGGPACGISTVTAPDAAATAAVWRAAAAHARRAFPDRPVVGWDPVEDVPALLAAGFADVGGLRVWGPAAAADA